MAIKNAVELESVLRVRLGISAWRGPIDTGSLRSAIAYELGSMISENLLPGEVVSFDNIEGWCNSMADQVRVDNGVEDNVYNIRSMCRRIMANYQFRPLAARVPVSAYLSALARSPPEAIAAVEDAERTTALESIMLQASLDPQVKMRERQAERQKMANTVMAKLYAEDQEKQKKEKEKQDKERLEEAREANPFQRVIDLD